MMLQLSTVPNAGLPAGFRKKTPNGDARMGAGIMFVSPDGRGLFLKRAGSDHGGEWAFPGGHVEDGEEPADTARREAMEEIGRLNGWGLHPLHRETLGAVDFTTFAQPVQDEFDPELNEEHDEFVWAPLTDPPKPLHPGVARLLAKFFEEESEEDEHAGSNAAEELRKRFAKRSVGATDSAMRLALDKSVRSFDTDGRMRVSIANISKANICPYRGEEIPGYEELGLEKDTVYQMLRDPEELRKAAPTFNGIQLLKKHVPVDANDHQMWDIVGCTGTDAAFDGTYLTNSLSVWTKEGIEFIESGDQRELSCGYHYVPDMTPGKFGGKHYDGVMRNIEGNHVALVEEGRAGHDVVVGDSALSERDDDMKPTRLEHAVLMRTAAAINPLLAFDAKVNYAPILKGINTKNFKQRRPVIMDSLKKAIKGRTIAKDASLEHLAKALDMFGNAEESYDESVSGPQHRAMEAAAHGHSTLGIPKSVGEEYSDADRGRSFGDMVRDWAKDKGLSDDDLKALDKMHMDSKDEMPEAALDEEETELEVEGEDESEEEEEAEDARHARDRRGAKDRKGAKDLKSAKDRKSAKDKHHDDADDAHEDDDADDSRHDDADDARDEDDADDRRGGARDRHGKDSKHAKDRKGAMDKKFVTVDEMNSAVAAATKLARREAQATAEARAFVEPIVGRLPIALDSALDVYRAAAKTLNIEDADAFDAKALRALIKTTARSAQAMDHQLGGADAHLAMDAAGDDDGSFDKMFGANRIGAL